MKRFIATAAALLVLSSAQGAMAATLQPSDPDGLNIRSGPSTLSQVLGTLVHGASATVLKEQGSWIEVKTDGGVSGWVSATFSRVSYEDEYLLAVIKVASAVLKAEPAAGAPTVGRAVQGQSLRLMERSKDFFLVEAKDGTRGWITEDVFVRVKLERAPEPAPAPPAQTPSPGLPVPPPGTKPEVPPAPPGPPGTTPPPAPADVVPKLAPLPAVPPIPVGVKEVWVLSSTGVHTGRNAQAFERVDTAHSGEKLAFLDAAEGWFRVRTPRGKQGWIPGTAAVGTEQNLRFSIAEGRWSLAYAGPLKPQSRPIRWIIRNSYGLLMTQGPTAGPKLITNSDMMELLESQSPWLKVKTLSGMVGWIHEDEVQPIPAPTVAPTQTETHALAASVQVTSPGVLQLDLEAPGRTLGQPVTKGTTLFIPVTTNQTTERVLPVRTAGIRSLAVGPNGVTLDLERMPDWKVLSQGAGKLSLVLQPQVSKVERKELADRTVVSFQVGGTVVPKVLATAGSMTLELQGAAFKAGTPLPAGITAKATPGSTSFTLASRRAYAVKRTAQGVELHLYKPGLQGKTILIDPGHGGFDPGAVNRSVGITEQQANLEISLRLRALLSAKGAKVLMTRITDSAVAPPEVIGKLTGTERTQADLNHRTRMANELGVDLFLSVHNNAGDPTAGGTETYYTSGTLNGGRSLELARKLQGSLLQHLQRKDRGVKDNLFFVTRNSEAPAALVEIAFVDHGWESRLLKTADFQQKAAVAMLQALEAFYAER